MNKRQLKLKDCDISKKRYKELCGFCEQYPEWKKELKYKNDTIKSKGITDMPILPAGGTSDQTGELALRRVELRKNCELIEQTAIMADSDLYQFIICSVCYETTFDYLQTHKKIPCSRAAFYDAKRYFFYLLNKNKKM